MWLTERAYALYGKLSRHEGYAYRTKVYAKALAHNLSDHDLRDYDLLFSIGSSEIAFLRTSAPIVHLTDATYAQMVGYYDGFNISEDYNREADAIQQAAYDNSAQIMFSSHWAADSGARDYEVPEEKANVVHFGPNQQVPDELDEQPVDGKIRLLFVGKDWGRKGGHIAVEAVNALERAGADATLTMVGCTPPREERLGPRVKAVRFVDDPAELFRASNAFILPTRAECSAIVYCEACAYGLPCFTTETGGVADYVEDGLNGYRLGLDATGQDFADKILSTFRETERYRAMRRRARQKYETDLNWGTWLERFEDIADKALSGKPRILAH